MSLANSNFQLMNSDVISLKELQNWVVAINQIRQTNSFCVKQYPIVTSQKLHVAHPRFRTYIPCTVGSSFA